MLLPINNLSRYRDPKSTPKIAEVIYTSDPKMLGRIKVQLIGMYDPIDEEGSNLPWIRKLDVGYGYNQNNDVPNIGDKVCIVWPYDDTHAFYKGIPGGSFIKPEFIESSTEAKGFTFGNLKCLVDKSIGGLTLTNGSGFNIQIDGMGNINIEGAKLYINSKYLIDITAPQINIDGALNTTESLESPDGEDGFISFMNIASVTNGKISGIF